MNEYLSRLLGQIQARETAGNIVITGLPGDSIVNDIYRLWRTSKIAGNMFSFQGRTKIVMPSFFGVEFLYMLKELRSVNTGRTTIRSINLIIKELEANTWLGNIDRELPGCLDFSQLNNFNVKPFLHQSNFLNDYNKFIPRYNLKGYVLAMGVGTGKTIGSLMAAECLLADHIIVVPPMRAVYKVWDKTVSGVYKRPQKAWIAADGKPLPAKPPRHCIFHYESLEYALKCVDAFRGKRVVVILDESHAMNELSAQRTQLFLDLVDKLTPISTLWCSATPIKALGSEMIPMLRSFDPLFTPVVQNSFKAIFGRSTIKGADIIRNRMGVVSFKAEVVKSKPVFDTIPVQLKNGQYYTLNQLRDDMMRFIKERMNYYKQNFKSYVAFYERCINIHRDSVRTPEEKTAFGTYQEYIRTIRKGYDAASMVELAAYCNRYELQQIIPSLPATLRGQFKDTRSVIKYMDLKVRGECLGRIVGRRRTEAVLELIPQAGLEKIVAGATKKTVMFTTYVEAVDVAANYLRSKGYSPLVVYGSTNRNLSAILSAFENDPKANPLIATYQSLSTAVELVSANTLVGLNVPFRDHDWEQAVGRIDRVSQDTQTEVFSLTLDTGNQPNITTRTMDILNWSKEQVGLIMGTKEERMVELGLEDLSDVNEYGIQLPYFHQTHRTLTW